MYKDKEAKKNVKNIFLSMCDVKVSVIYFTEYGTALTTVLPILFLYLNTVIVTAGTFEP
jgi:hypothetical protein